MTKLTHYFRNPHIMHYLIVVPATRTVIHHRRHAAGIAMSNHAAGAIDLDPPGLVLVVEDLFAMILG